MRATRPSEEAGESQDEHGDEHGDDEPDDAESHGEPPFRRAATKIQPSPGRMPSWLRHKGGSRG
jgi:hypothetical protein